MTIIAEYIWIDGSSPTRRLRSKTKIIHQEPTPDQMSDMGELLPRFFPSWQFDGSSTAQAEGGSSDCLLKPVRIYPDPTRGTDSWLVLCEVNGAQGLPHPSNTRAQLRRVLDAGAHKAEGCFGFEQEYTLYEGSRPLGFPSFT